MEYLLFLNRFELDINKLKHKIVKLDNSAVFHDEEKNILVNSKLEQESFMKFHEIKGTALIFSNWKDFSFGELKKNCLELCEKNDISSYIIENKFYDKVKISAKSLYRHINPYLKHENILFDINSNNIIYLELKKFDKILKYRLCYSSRNLFNRINSVSVDMDNFIAVLAEPKNVLEIEDFLRLCWIFKLPLYIITNDKLNFNKIFNRAKDLTKGIDYDKFIIKILSEFPKDYILVGFSKHSDKNEVDMREIILSGKKMAFVFGDDKFGLSQESRDKLDYCFRLTPEIKKPLRASHAFSYVLGFYTANKI